MPDSLRAAVSELDPELALGPGLEGLEGDEGLVHWSATLVALVTLNSRAPAVAEAPPAFAVAELPEAEAFASGVVAEAVVPGAFEPMPVLAVAPPSSCPVTCTSFPIRVRTAPKSPVNLYVLPDLSVSV